MNSDSDGEITQAVTNLNTALQDQERNVYVSANRLRRGGMSAARHVVPDAVADIADSLIDRSDPGANSCRHVARIFDFVHEDIGYEHTGGGFSYSPEDLLDRGQGNCVDQSVLLCSLLESQGFTTRLYSIKRKESGHMLAGVGLDLTNQNQVWTDLVDYYTGGMRGMQFNFATQTPVSENTRYTILDPEYSEYPGDISALADDEYVSRQSTGWEFTNLKQTVKPRDAESL